MKIRSILSLLPLAFLLLSCGNANQDATPGGESSATSKTSDDTSLAPSYPSLEEFKKKCAVALVGYELTVTKWLAVTKTNVEIPAYVEDNGNLLEIVALGDECFQNSSVTKITLPNTLASIGKACFAQTNINEITLPDSVESIGDYAFYRCKRLADAALNDGLKAIGVGAFGDCTRLRSFVVPDSVVSIGRSAFKGCTSLKSLTTPFAGGSRSTNAYMAYLYGALDNSHYADQVDAALKEVTITKESVAAFSFYHLEHIEKVTLLDSVTKIASHAFEGCTSLTSVVGLDHVTSIGEAAFKGCTSFVDIKLSNDLNSMGKDVFDYADLSGTTYLGGKYLASKDNPYAVFVKYDGGGAGLADFQYHEDCIFIARGAGAETQIMPSGLKGIGDSAFAYTGYLKHIVFQEGIETIPYHAFYSSGLEWLVVPKSLKEIHPMAFYESSFSKVYYRGNAEEITSIIDMDTHYYWFNAAKYFYSESEPLEAGNYWHEVDGLPVEW